MVALLPFKTLIFLFFFHLFYVYFFFQSLIEWSFSALCKNEKREKNNKLGRGYFFYSGIKKVAAVVIKASVYAGFSVVIWLVVWCIYTSIRSFSDNFSYGMKMSSSFFVLFGVLFLLKL